AVVNVMNTRRLRVPPGSNKGPCIVLVKQASVLKRMSLHKISALGVGVTSKLSTSHRDTVDFPVDALHLDRIAVGATHGVQPSQVVVVKINRIVIAVTNLREPQPPARPLLKNVGQLRLAVQEDIVFSLFAPQFQVRML